VGHEAARATAGDVTERAEIDVGPDRPLWPGWCCSYCSQPLLPRPHGLFCDAEGRFFANVGGIYRLLPEERRREILPFLEMYQRVRRDEGWRARPGLPETLPDAPNAAVWKLRAASFRRAMDVLGRALPAMTWRALEIGAGCCWASLRLLERGHRVAAVDVNLDPDDGLPAADRISPLAEHLPRAEAEMESLPFEPGSFDLVLATGALHYTSRLSRTLVELRRVTRRGGVLIAWDSPVYRRREDGEAMVSARMQRHRDRYGVAMPREGESGYLVLGELAGLFASAGWMLEVHGWPGRPREIFRDALEKARVGRRTARFPVLLARRDG
jgi:SAM-dependent methyltransferase